MVVYTPVKRVTFESQPLTAQNPLWGFQMLTSQTSASVLQCLLMFVHPVLLPTTTKAHAQRMR